MLQELTGSTMEILLVEDNPGDVLLTEEALQEGEIPYSLHVVSDGEEALRFLHKENNYINSPVPHIIILDLNLPKLSGREVLAEIKNDSNLKSIPVVVLSTSNSSEDIFKSYELHANCYVTKPIDYYQFSKVVRSIQEFWMTVVVLPRV